MKAINININNLNTIKMALFIAINVKALKNSPLHDRMNELLNWLNQYDNNDEIAITNTKNITITIEKEGE